MKTQREKSHFVLLALVLCLALVVSASAQTITSTSGISASSDSATSSVPRLVRFSGTAKDANNKPLTGTVGVTFFLYRDQVGGAPLWMETQNVQPDSHGSYTVQLGVTKPNGLPTDIFSSGEARWVGVQISGQPEQPRALLLAVPYALKAADAETIGGLPASAFVRSNPEGGSATRGSVAGASGTSGKSGSRPPSNVTGQGTANYVPLWTGSGTSTTIGNSNLYQTPAGSFGVGTTTPSAKFEVDQNAFSSGTNAIVGYTTDINAAGVSGKATRFSTSAVGVSGSALLTGVVGTATDTRGFFKHYGVVGTSNSSNGAGVFGQGPSYGVFGTASGTDGQGVYGSATGSTGQGVRGESFATNYGTNGGADGVQGVSHSNNGSGVAGSNTAQFGTGVYGQGGPGGYAGVFRGNVDVRGNALEVFTGDPNCGTGTAAIAFGSAGFSNCGNYALRGDSGGNLYINSSSTGWMFFDNNNGNLMTLESSGRLDMKDGANESGGTWNNASDRNLKTNFSPVNGRHVLARLNKIPMLTWNYKTDDRSIRHLGPMAQDFYAAFGLDGKDDKHISTLDEGGVALAAIQELYRIVLQQDKENHEKDLQVQNLTAEVERLRNLEQAVQILSTKLAKIDASGAKPEILRASK